MKCNAPVLHHSSCLLAAQVLVMRFTASAAMASLPSVIDNHLQLMHHFVSVQGAVHVIAAILHEGI
jgi:hypothetical protein